MHEQQDSTASVPRTGGLFFTWRAVVLTGLAAALAPLAAPPADAACFPASCNAQFDCGFRTCGGVACMIFFFDAGTSCRPAAGVCDAEETCTGESLACPGDEKLGAAAVCNPALDECDGAERCDGVSNDCPADVGVTPEISRVTLLDRTLRDGPITNQNVRLFTVELQGANLCEATVDAPEFDTPMELGGAGPQTRLGAGTPYLVSSPPFPSTTFSFSVNRGAAGGTLGFVAGAPDGYVDIVSPSSHATVGNDPVFTISNGCPNCDVLRAELIDDSNLDLIATTPILFALPPLATPTALGLADFAEIAPPAVLAEGNYQFTVDAIDGGTAHETTFGGDPSGIEFSYQFGTSERNRIYFAVPEAAADASTIAAAVALIGIAARARRGSR